MKRFVSLFLSLLLIFSPLSFGAWDDTAPAGSSNASDIDTNVTANNAALEGMLDEVRGWKNLKVVRDSATQVTVTADVLYLQSSSNLAVQFGSVSESIAITSSGASGLDTGAEASGTWYYIWIISKSSDGTINGLLSASATSPTMPSGYDQKTLVSAVRNNSSSDFVDFIQVGKMYAYTAGINVFQGTGTSALSNINSGQVGASSAGTNKISAGYEGQYAYQFSLLTADTIYYGTSTTTWTAIDVSSACPSSLSTHIWGSTFSSGSNQYVYVQGFVINKL